MRASHELLDHTSELRLRVRAASLGELLGEAGRALGALELAGRPADPSGHWREIELRAADHGALLVDWLNELLYLAETERWVPVEFLVEHADESAARVRARGVPVPRAPGFVKAATFHDLRIEEVPGGWEAEVVLDV